MNKFFLAFAFLLISTLSFAQREKGKILKAPKIFQKDTRTEESSNTTKDATPAQNEVEFQFEEQPRLRFSTTFETSSNKTERLKSDVQAEKSLNGDNLPFRLEPIRQVNSLVEDDTSSIDEGKLQIVEIEEFVGFNDPSEMVKVASYYSIWDTRTVDPYGINPTDFEEIIPLKLYDLNENRYWNSPLDRCPITSHFKFRNGRWHRGTDIDLETGDPVYAVFDGIVRVASGQSGWGNTVLVRHYNGLETLYAHLSKILVEPNRLVKAGDKIGLGGNTGRSSGSHLHIETRYEGNPFDSENIFRYSGTPNGTEVLAQEFLLAPTVFNYLRGGKPKVSFDGDEAEASEEEGEDEPKQISNITWIRIKRGDNLTQIAARFNTTVAALCELNKIRPNHTLMANARFRIK